ncbi:MAG: NAD(P)/FAD-dependent oxidoreductase, partial [Bacteroidota bacterium]
MNSEYHQIIIGSGFAGLCAAIKLKDQGEKNFVILERNNWLGGTWYDNHYPGAECDVESHLYSFSFEPNPNWSKQFSPQEEILRYMEYCVEKYDLKKHLQFNTTVSKAVFDDAKGTWKVTDEAGKTYSAKVVVSCVGGLSQACLPDIKGIDTFKGKKFHSAAWDRSFDINNKTVAVIGTGASAIQIVPAIAADVKQLNLFQRTPPWIMPKPDKQISSLRKWMYNHFPFTQRLYRGRLYWQHELMAFGFVKNQGLLKFGS